MNPTKGEGVRYIYCPHDGGECLDLVIERNWSAFNCECCEIYLKSESALGARLWAQDKDENAGAQHTVPVDKHIERPAVAETMAGETGEIMTEKCLVEDCEQEGKHRGLCSAHIQKFRKGNLLGVDPLPSNRGKSPKKGRIELIKKSATRVRNIKTVNDIDPLPFDKMPAGNDFPSIVKPGTPIFIDEIKAQNSQGIRTFAQAFVLSLKSEIIPALIEHMKGEVECTK
jgi:hypothetical protein